LPENPYLTVGKLRTEEAGQLLVRCGFETMKKINRVIRDERMKSRFFLAIYVNEIYLFSFV
jgi:hypothetical protein